MSLLSLSPVIEVLKMAVVTIVKGWWDFDIPIPEWHV